MHAVAYMLLARLVAKLPDTHVIVIDKLDYSSCIANLEPIAEAPNFTFIKADICNAALLCHVIRTKNVDCIVHAATQTHVDDTLGNSLAFCTTNVVGTHCILECCNQFKEQIKRIVHLSSDEVYGPSPARLAAIEESQRIGPTHPYAATKASAELLVQAYRSSFHLPTIILRSNSCFGPRQHPEKVLPKWICRALEKQNLVIHGDGSDVRGWLYIEDYLDALEIALHRGRVGETYNIGAREEMTVRELAARVARLFGLDAAAAVHFTEGRVGVGAHEDVRRRLDSSKLAALGWRPRADFDDAVRATAAWYRDNLANWPNALAALAAHPRAGVTPTSSSGGNSPKLGPASWSQLPQGGSPRGRP
eukprot:tig00001278_g7982.t1